MLRSENVWVFALLFFAFFFKQRDETLLVLIYFFLLVKYLLRAASTCRPPLSTYQSQVLCNCSLSYLQQRFSLSKNFC